MAKTGHQGGKTSKEVQRRADEKRAEQRAEKRAEQRAGKKARGWACIVYPESAPPHWMMRLEDSHIPTLISPLHDRDVNADGEIKKEHYHVMAMWDGPTTLSTAAEYFGSIKVTAPPELIRNLRGYARYLVHKDNPEKAQYNPADVVGLSGAVWTEIAIDSEDETERILCEIEDYIDEEDCVSYHKLRRYARHERPEWCQTIRHNSYHLTQYMKALWQDHQYEIEQCAIQKSIEGQHNQLKAQVIVARDELIAANSEIQRLKDELENAYWRMERNV